MSAFTMLRRGRVVARSGRHAVLVESHATISTGLVSAFLSLSRPLCPPCPLPSQSIEFGKFSDVSLAFLERTCLEFTRATRVSEVAAVRLWEQVGEVPTLGGEPYPGPGSVGGEQLLTLMSGLRDAAKASMMKVLGREAVFSLSA